jgi:hypothetical protein
VFTLIFTVSYFGHSSSRSWSFMFTLPCFVVLNNMSCHIYRNIRLGHYDKSTFIVDRAIALAELDSGSKYQRSRTSTPNFAKVHVEHAKLRIETDISKVHRNVRKKTIAACLTFSIFGSFLAGLLVKHPFINIITNCIT